MRNILVPSLLDLVITEGCYSNCFEPRDKKFLFLFCHFCVQQGRCLKEHLMKSHHDLIFLYSYFFCSRLSYL